MCASHQHVEASAHHASAIWGREPGARGKSRRVHKTASEQQGQARGSGQHGAEAGGEAIKSDELRCICPFSFHTNPRGGNGFHCGSKSP